MPTEFLSTDEIRNPAFETEIRYRGGLRPSSALV